MATKSITLTAAEMEKRITHAVRALSRKNFTEKQLKQYIVNGKIPGESKKRTKSGYQLYLDEFRKDLSKEERAQIGQVAKKGGAAWKALDDDEKAPFLEKAAELREAALADQPVKEKKAKKSKKKTPEPVADSDAEEDKPKTPPKKAKKSKKKTPEPVADSDAEEDKPKTPPKKAKKSKNKTPAEEPKAKKAKKAKKSKKKTAEDSE